MPRGAQAPRSERSPETSVDRTWRCPPAAGDKAPGNDPIGITPRRAYASCGRPNVAVLTARACRVGYCGRVDACGARGSVAQLWDQPGRVGMEEGPKGIPAPLSGGMDDGARGGEAVCTPGGAEADRDRPAELALPRSRSAPLPVKGRRRGRERKRRDSALRFPRRRARFWPGGPPESSARAGRERWQGGVDGDGAVQDAVPDPWDIGPSPEPRARGGTAEPRGPVPATCGSSPAAGRSEPLASRVPQPYTGTCRPFAENRSGQAIRDP